MWWQLASTVINKNVATGQYAGGTLQCCWGSGLFLILSNLIYFIHFIVHDKIDMISRCIFILNRWKLVKMIYIYYLSTSLDRKGICGSSSSSDRVQLHLEVLISHGSGNVEQNVQCWLHINKRIICTLPSRTLAPLCTLSGLLSAI